MQLRKLVENLRETKPGQKMILPLSLPITPNDLDGSIDPESMFWGELNNLIEEKDPVYIEVKGWDILSSLHLGFYFHMSEHPVVAAMIKLFSLPIAHIHINFGETSELNDYSKKAMQLIIAAGKKIIAMDTKEKAKQKAPGDEAKIIGVPTVTFEINDDIERHFAKSFYKAVLETDMIDDQDLAEAEVYNQKGLFNDALLMLSEAIGRDKDSISVFARRGQILQEHEFFREAYVDYSDAIKLEISQNGMNSDLLSRLYYLRGEVSLAIGGERELNLADRDFGRIKPGHAKYHAALAKRDEIYAKQQKQISLSSSSLFGNSHSASSSHTPVASASTVSEEKAQPTSGFLPPH